MPHVPCKKIVNNKDKGSMINDLKLSWATSQKMKIHLKNQMLCQEIQREKIDRTYRDKNNKVFLIGD